MTELDSKTFDISAALTGRSYPEDVVAVYLDEAVGYEIYKNEIELRRLSILGKSDEYQELDKETDELKDQIAHSRLEFHIRGLPRKVARDLEKKVTTKYPVQTNPLNGEEIFNQDREEYRNNLVWAAFINRIVDANGAEFVAPGPSTIEEIRNYAPAAALEAIDTAIVQLTQGAKSGFETAAKDADFLSAASAEA